MTIPLFRVASLVALCVLAACSESPPPPTNLSPDASESCDTPCGSECCAPNQACVDGACECVPQCAGRRCGSNGCGGSCGSCAQGESCNPTTFVCESGCVAESDEAFCRRADANCGPVTAEDNCRHARTVNCGSCAPQTCNLTTHRCEGGCEKEPDAVFCADRGVACGPASGEDRCGVQRSVVDCGACNPAERCEQGSCVLCDPELDSAMCSRNEKQCGEFSGVDNCGATRTVASCGSCGANKVCAATNVCTVPGAPANDSCSGAQALVFGADGRVQVNGTTVGATNDQDACGSRGADVVYKFTVSTSSSVDITLTPVGVSYDVALYVTRRCDSTAAADLVACVDDQVGGEPERAELRHLAPGTYWVWVDGYFPSTKGAFTLELHRWDSPPTPDNDLCLGAEPLVFDASGRAVQTVDTSTATNDYAGTCGAMDGPDLVYSFELGAPAGIVARVSRSAGATDLQPAVYLRSLCTGAGSIDQVVCATHTAGVATATVASLPAGTWYVFVDSASARGGSFTLEVIKLPPVTNSTCSNPTVLSFDPSGVATASANTIVASPDASASCGGLNGNDVVYVFTTSEVMDFSAVVTPDATLQPTIYLRSACEMASTEPANGCASAPAVAQGARLTVPGLAAKTWYLWVDGANGTSGAFDLTVTLKAVAGPPPNDACDGAEPLDFDPVTGIASVNGDTTGAADHYTGSCAQMPAADLVYSFELSRPMAVIAKVTRDPLSPGFNPAVYLRNACENGARLNEPACAVHSGGVARVVAPMLGMGKHHVIVDGTGTGRGAFHLEVQLLPAVENSDCSGAEPLSFDASGIARVVGDTSLASNDATGLCASAGPDVVYRFTLPAEKDVLVTASPLGPSGGGFSVHVRSECDLAASELGCAAASSAAADAVLALTRLPGATYYVWVDGATSASGGPFALSVATSDPQGAPSNDTCRSATPLTLDPLTNSVAITGTTVGAANDYAGTCSTGTALHTGPDVVYSFTLSAPAAVVARVARTGSDTTFKPAVYLRSGDCESTRVLDEAFCGRESGGVVRRTAVKLGVGTHYVVVDGVNGSAGSFELELTAKPVVDIPDNCALAKSLVFDASGKARVRGDTAQANDTSTGRCSASPGSDLVYSFTLGETSNVTARAFFDGLANNEWRTVYVRKECGSYAAADELACGSGIESAAVLVPELSPGTYYVWVDHDGRSGGTFELEVTATKVMANDTCRGAAPLTFNPVTGIATASGDTSFTLNDGDGSCSSSSGPDAIYWFELDAPKRVQVDVSTTGHRPNVHVRSVCDRPTSEIACAVAASSATSTGVTIPVLPQGTYYVWVDGYASAHKGPFDLKVTATAPLQAPPANTNCSGAQRLSFDASNKAILKGQSTANAGNDSSGTCEVTGGGDVVYSFTTTLAHKVTAKVTRTTSTFNPVVYIRNACDDGEASAELTCAKHSSGTATATVNQLPAGTYYVWVDGAGGTSGNFDLEVALTAPVASAPVHESCATAKPLVFTGPTLTENGTTYQAQHEARGSCATTEVANDVVYSLQLRSAQKITATVTPSSTTYRPALYIRSDCGSADVLDELVCTAANAAGAATTVELQRAKAGTYFLWVDGDTATAGDFVLTVTLDTPETEPANNTCASPIKLALGDVVTGSTVAADDSYGVPPFSAACDSYTTRKAYGRDVVYSYVPARTGNFTVTLTPNQYDAFLWVSAGVCGAPRSCIAAKNSGGVGGAETITIAGEAGTTYFIVVDGASRANQGSFTLRLQ